MLKVTDDKGQTHALVTESTFKLWVYRVMLAYAILAIALVFGVWALTKHGNHEIIDKINNFGVASCLANNSDTGTIHKYNDLVDDLIESRTRVLNDDIARGDTDSAKNDQLAIKRYQMDKIPVSTKEQCQTPLLER